MSLPMTVDMMVPAPAVERRPRSWHALTCPMTTQDNSLHYAPAIQNTFSRFPCLSRYHHYIAPRKEHGLGEIVKSLVQGIRPAEIRILKTVLNTRNAVGSSTSTTVNQEIKTQSNRESKVDLSLYNRAHTTDQVPSHVLPRTIKPPSNKVTFQPNSVNLFLSAGLRTPTPLAECFPRPVTIFKGLAAD